MEALKLKENVPLAPWTTLQVGGPARYFVEATSEGELGDALAWAEARRLPLDLLGGGSNLLVPDAGYPGLIVRLAMLGIERDGANLRVAAGESWDGVVDAAINAELAGIECLAGIPGTAGATPVQNVGAYGQDVAQTLTDVRALDRQRGVFVNLSASECGFQYRRSIFNGEQHGRYIISGVHFRLVEGGEPNLGYADLQRRFAGQAGEPTLGTVAAAVRQIRARKGMVLDSSDRDTCSAGSYFRNPVVAATHLAHIAAARGVDSAEVPHWAAGEQRVKLSAAWLLEQAGFKKGFRLGAAGLSTKHSLALTNRGGATCADILRLEEAIREGVKRTFDVVLEREPVMLSAPTQTD